MPDIFPALPDNGGGRSSTIAQGIFGETICSIARNGRPELRWFIPASAHAAGRPVGRED